MRASVWLWSDIYRPGILKSPLTILKSNDSSLTLFITRVGRKMTYLSAIMFLRYSDLIIGSFISYLSLGNRCHLTTLINILIWWPLAHVDKWTSWTNPDMQIIYITQIHVNIIVSLTLLGWSVYMTVSMSHRTIEAHSESRRTRIRLVAERFIKDIWTD